VAEEKGAEATRDKNRRIREEAAAKRRSKRENDNVTARRPTLGQLEASEIMDDAFARTTHAVTGWVRRHFTVVQWVIVVALVGGIGYQVYVHHKGKVEGRTTDALVAGVTEELSRVGDEAASEDAQTGLGDPRPVHKTHEERLKAAEAAYRKVSEGDNAKALARLGLAGVLYDQKKFKDALAEYRAVKDGPLAQKDADVRARSIEGVGLSQEGAGELDAALKTFHELANQDSAPVSALGLYHQARIEKSKGELDKAKSHLTAALKKIADSKLEQVYVEQVARELLGSIDPSAVPPPSPQSLTKEQRAQLEQIEKLKKMAEQTQKAAQNAGPKDVSEDALKKLMQQINEKMPERTPPPAPSSSAP
jgi:predicted negative regulator of RcsB-dependent stress response